MEVREETESRCENPSNMLQKPPVESGPSESQGDLSERFLPYEAASFRQMFEESPFGVAMLGRNRELIHFNSSLCGMLGYSEDELSKLTLFGIVHPDDLPKDIETCGQPLQRGDSQLQKRTAIYEKGRRPIMG